MSEITIEVQNSKQVAEHLARAAKGSAVIYDRAMFEAVSTVKALAQKNLYPGHGVKTGTLRRSIFTQVEHSPLKGVVGVPPTVKYGPYVEYGTSPHVIEARGRALAFKGSDGVMVFRKRVNHPGTKETPYMRPAAQESVAIVNEVFRVAVEAVVRLAAK